MLIIVPGGPVPRVHAATGDFAISASPNQLTLAQGATSSSAITVTAQGGYQGNLTLVVPETYDSIDVSVQFTPQVLQLNSTHQIVSSVARISIQAILPGIYTFDVAAYDGINQRTSQISLTVTGQDFSISENPSQLPPRLDFPLAQNTTIDISLNVTSIGGFSGSVSLTVSVSSNYPPVPMLPSVSLSANMVTISPSAPASFLLIISVNSSIVAHQYDVEVVGVGATTVGVSRGFSFTVVVGADFSMLMQPRNLIVHQGSIGVSTLWFFSLNGYAGSIGAYSGIIAVNPPNPDIQLYPSSPSLLPGGGNSSLIVVKTDSRTGLGIYHVAIEASDDMYGGHLGESLAYNITVEGPATGPDFKMSADPVQTAGGLGTSVYSDINLIGVNGYSRTVGLYSSIGSRSSFAPASLTVSSVVNSTSIFSMTLPGPIQGGGGPGWWYSSGIGTVTIIAADATGLAHEISVNITATPYTFVAYPASQLARANSTVTFGFSTRPIDGFNGTVALTLANPPGLAATLDKTLLNFSAHPSLLYSQLEVNVPTGTPDGVYTFQVTATYMRPEYLPFATAPKQALTYTIPVDVTVWSPASSPTIFGLQPLEFYGIVAGSAVAAVLVTYFVLQRRKPIQDSKGLGLGYVTGVLRRLG